MATDATTKGFVLIAEDVKVISRKMFLGTTSALALAVSDENDPKTDGSSRKCCFSASTRC